MTKDSDDNQAFADILGEVFRLWLQKEMQPPLLFAAVACNGACMFGRCTRSAQRVEFSTLWKHGSDDFQAPIHLVLVDDIGTSAHSRIEEGRAIRH